MQFTQIPGHQIIKNRLLNASNNGRLPHAILLHGPEGNGALALALSLISYELCEQKTETDACGVCDSCSKTNAFIHPDVHFSFPTINSDGSKLSDVFLKEWRKALTANPFLNYEDWMETIKGKDDQSKQGNITAEECREILKKLSLKSYEGGKKFMVMWLPEFLGQSGNILLKLLEEPPEETHFILIAEDLNQMLPTIVSRTQIFNINAFTPNIICEYLKSKHGIEESDALAISFLSKGNISLAQHLMHEEENQFTENMRVWLQYCYANNTVSINEWVNKTSSLGREKIKQFLENCLYIFGECLHNLFIENHKLRVPDANVNFIVNISKLLTEQKIERIYKHINESIMHIERNANAKITMFNLSLTLRNILRGKP